MTNSLGTLGQLKLQQAREAKTAPTLPLVRHNATDVGPLSEHTLSGYAGVFGNVDAHLDVIRPGAFDKWVRLYRRQRDRVLLLAEHVRDEPEAVLGVEMSHSVNDYGLFMDFQLLERTAGYVVQRVRSREWDGLSIGYHATRTEDPTAEEWARGARRAIVECFVTEVSLVRNPANTGARVLDSKSAGELLIDRVVMALRRQREGVMEPTAQSLLASDLRAVLRTDFPVEV
jgi:HK97 family phage prohead protease